MSTGTVRTGAHGTALRGPSGTATAHHAPAAPLTPHADQRAVDALLRESLERGRRRAVRFGPENDQLWTEIARSVEGGKRFRSALVLGAHAALGGERPHGAVVVAAGFELLHTAFLIHDDLIDNDTVRRGRPNLFAVMQSTCLEQGTEEPTAHRWSQAAALLAGDLTLSLAHRMFASAGLPHHTHDQLVDLVDETLLVSAGGELVDTAFGLGLRTPSLEETFTVSESKTAMYSFRAPMLAGAILGGASDAMLEDLDRLGILLGRTFQLVDDLLGVFAPEERIGKSNLSDLREGKQTPLMLRARQQPVWDEISAHVGRPDLDQEAAAVVRAALARSHAPAEVEQWARDGLAQVHDGAAALPVELARVVQSMAGQVAEALDEVVADIEEVRCPAV